MQNITERNSSDEEADRKFADDISSNIRVAIPAIVVSFDATKQTIVAQPTIRERIVDRTNGIVSWVTLPQLVDIPVVFPQGGSFVMTFPVATGDEVLLISADLCIDGWWASGGIQNWNDRRRHDLSDCFALLGINSIPNIIDNIATDAVELRTKNGLTSVRVAENEITFTATNINIDGNLIHNGHNYLDHEHIHGGGTGNSGPVDEI